MVEKSNSRERVKQNSETSRSLDFMARGLISQTLVGSRDEGIGR